MRSYLLVLAAGAVLALPVQAGDRRHPADAALHAVQFLDADVGYAVGDEGVICKTINGGKSWEVLPSNIRSSFRSIHMLSHLVGWVVGRDELPAGSGSVGIVLFTQDGGETWRRILDGSVPGLNRIRFGDADTALLMGDANDQFPTGLLITTDGGRKWRPVPGQRCTSWLGGDLLDGKTASLAGAWSQLGTMRDGNFGKTEVEAFGGRNVRGLQLNPVKSFAVGQGGLVLESKTLGAGWGFSDTKLPPEVLAACDFSAVCCVGEKVWIVGRPGSTVLCSEDRGSTWKVHQTGQNLPLNAVHFFDEKRGWAAGELGCILCTSDGGKSWTVQRRGGQRAAVLCVHARGEDLPADAIAMLGEDRGLLTVALRIAGPDPKSESASAASQGHRFAAAHRAVGGAAAEMLWQFPLPEDYAFADKSELLKYWDRLHGDNAAQQMLRQLVLAIRIWQPDVIVTDHPDSRTTGNSAGALVAEAMHEAFRQAADAKAFPEQIEQLGLKPWRASKLYGLWDKRDGSHLEVDNGKESGILQATYAEHAVSAVRLLAPGSSGQFTPVSIPSLRFYRLLDTAQAGAPKGLLDGINLGKAGDCSRQLAAAEEPDPALAAAMKAQRQLAALARNAHGGLVESPQLLSQLGAVLSKLPEDRGAKAAYAMAGEFIRQGQWDLARDVFIEMSERYPLHPLAGDACRWLIRHNTSSEARRRQELGQFLIAGQTAQPGAAITKDPKTGKLTTPPIIEQASFVGKPGDLIHWYQGSLLLARRLAGLGSLHINDSSIQFCLQASNRRLGKIKEAQEYLRGYANQPAEGPWREAAAQELWAAERAGQSPRPILECRWSKAKPYLDGAFDEACWQDRKPVVLKDAIRDSAKENETEVMLSYDDKYLYVALRCKHPAGQGQPPAKERPRDADLRPFDRVSILLDLDRDYSTYFQLQVDQRGCVCEDCWGDKRWNPQWFVAIRSDDSSWQIEAAIPLHELTSDRIAGGTAWACNIVRILPSRGVQACSAPAGVEPRPEGMALVVFQDVQ